LKELQLHNFYRWNTEEFDGVYLIKNIFTVKKPCYSHIGKIISILLFFSYVEA